MFKLEIISKIKIFTSSFILLSFSLLPFPSFSAPPAITFPIDTFIIDGQLPSSAEKMDQLLASFEGKEYGLKELQTISKKIERLIRDEGFAFYRVILPPQSLADGHVFFKLVSFSIDNIEFVGNEFFDNTNIFDSLPELSTQNSPNTKLLAQQIKVANHHVNKDVSIIFKQSTVTDRVSAKVDVIEQKPYRFSLLANNMGSDDSGNARITAAYQYSNLWNKDHNIHFSYTSSPNHTEDVKQYSTSYSAPLYSLGGWLSAYYAKTDIKTGRINLGDGNGMDVSGSGDMFGLHYLQFLPKHDKYEHLLDIGFDNRLFTNNIVISNASSTSGDIGPDVRSTPLTLTYKGNIALPSIYIGHHISWSKNIGIGSLNDNEAYSLARSGSKDNWDLVRYGFFINFDQSGWLYRASVKGLYSNEPLIPGEQFGLGGSYSVRGYNEREVSVDQGNSLSLEAYTPQWNNMKLVGFYDYGQGRNNDALQAGVEKEVHLASVGIGLRWQWKSNVQVSIDFAHTLRAVGDTSDNHNHAHANIILQY